ncbi:hypothetical protein ACFL09_01585 [Planctomycetota bacterium]
MHITIDEFREYAEANADRKRYETSRGTSFSFELLDSAKPVAGFPFRDLAEQKRKAGT